MENMYWLIRIFMLSRLEWDAAKQEGFSIKQHNRNQNSNHYKIIISLDPLSPAPVRPTGNATYCLVNMLAHEFLSLFDFKLYIFNCITIFNFFFAYSKALVQNITLMLNAFLEDSII